MDHSTQPPKPTLDYDGIRNLAENEAHSAADSARQKALNEMPVGTEITKKLAASVAEIYRSTFDAVYSERLQYYENAAFFQDVGDFLQ